MAEHLQRSPTEVGVRSGVLFGVMMGGMLALFSSPFLLFSGPFVCVAVPAVFVVGALLAGPPFGIAMGMVVHAVTARPEVRAGETLRAFGGANVSGNGGMLALSDQRLWFASHGMNFSRPDFDLPLDEIDRVDGSDGLFVGKLTVRTRVGKTLTLKLDFAPKWEKHVVDALPA